MSALGLNIGMKSLLAAQANLETIGHNLSNANTPGYSRQALQVSSSSPIRLRGLVQGTGVSADTITRTVDSILHGRISSQVSSLGRIDARLETISTVESLLGGTSASGMPALFKKMFQSLASLQTAPEDPMLRTGAVQSSMGLVAALNRAAGNAQSLQRNAFLQMDATVAEVNALAQRISDLNRQITGSELGTSTANDLRDRRDQLVKELSQFVDVRAVEDARGAVRVLVGGRILVSPTSVEQLELGGDPASGSVTLSIDGQAIDSLGGRLGGLLGMQTGYLDGIVDQLDDFAHNLALEANRVHSTGIPRSGSFSFLVGDNTIADSDGDGDREDELISRAGLPFDIQSGALYVNVVNRASGATTKHRIDIDANRTTVGDLVDAFGAIPNLSASVDVSGRLQVVADAGFGFDFSPRLEAAPDTLGSFGGGKASIATAREPFALSVGDTLDLVGANGPFTVTLSGAGFASISAATAEELAAVLRADAGFQASGLVASAQDGALVLQSAGTGAGEMFQLAGGSALAALGLSAGTTVSGSDHDIAPTISGNYNGSQAARWTFRPNMDGTIGTTQGLRIEVFDESGVRVAELDVGPGYTPGDEIEIKDGVRIAFAFGDVSATARDAFHLDVVADADMSDVLVALGMNSMFTGSTAQDIAVRDDLVLDPSLFSVSLSGAPGDGGNVLRLLEIESERLAGLGSQSLDEHLSGIVSGVALEIEAAQSAREAEQFLLDGLETRRDQVSGVNTDEELVRMIEQEQAYNAAAQYLRVVSELTAELMNIL